MKMQTFERIKQQWQFAADSMPQLICLVDGEGRVMHANRTLERWKLGEVETVRGVDLHDVVHKRCSDPGCYLRLFWQRTATALAQDRRARCDVWDPLLKRHFEIRTQMPAHGERAGSEDFFAVVTIDDVTEWEASEDQSRRAAQILNQRVERDEQNLARAERVQSHLLAILDKTPVFTAMADRTGTLFYLNPAGRTLMGLEDGEEFSGLTLIECQAPGARAHIVEEALPAAERDGVWSGDSVLISRDGREFKSYLTLIAHRDEPGRLEGFSLLGRNMSEWVRTEEALRATQNQLWRLSAQHLTIQESERRRIAVDLHDGLGQTLSLVKLSIEDAARSVSAGVSSKAAATLERLGPTVKSALAELRRISMNLRPSTLDDLGILATLSWYFREFEAACPNMNLAHDISVAEADVPNLLKISIFRIVQEATSNALKHARAERIKVCLRGAGESLELLIEDNGQGFDPAAAAGSRDFSHGLGLQSMKERAELSGGDYEFRSAPGQGTRIRVRWPALHAAERDWAAIPEASVLFMHQLTPADRRLPERFSQCLACMKRLASQQERAGSG
jgi:PAS domain S-box-containing protein